MSQNLAKGEKVALTENNPGVQKFTVGCGWDVNASGGNDFDLDVSAFILGENGKLVDENHMVFYNRLKSPNDFVVHSGDNRTGQGEGDDETLTVDFSKVTGTEKKVVFVVTIDKGAERNQNFGQVNGAYIRICDAATNTEILKYDLNEDASAHTAMNFGELYEKDGEWKFQAVGTGSKDGLQHYVDQF